MRLCWTGLECPERDCIGCAWSYVDLNWNESKIDRAYNFAKKLFHKVKSNRRMLMKKNYGSV